MTMCWNIQLAEKVQLRCRGLNLFAFVVCISFVQPIVLKSENSGLEDWCI